MYETYRPEKNAIACELLTRRTSFNIVSYRREQRPEKKNPRELLTGRVEFVIVRKISRGRVKCVMVLWCN